MKKTAFIPGKTYIPSSGKVYDNKEINNVIKAARDGWWTEGEFAKQFEKKFSAYLGIKYVSLVNSGSSANLLSVASLTSKVFGNRSLKKGDEFITTPASFPTTVNPGLLYGLTPVFVDIKLDTLNIDEEKIEKAITGKTRLIMIAHTLGKPFNLDKIVKIARKYNLWLIEDCCDALGSKYDGKYVGTFGDIATFSFYPAHQITMGEGGAVITNNSLIHRSLRQFRDWGRDCWCDTGKDNTCRKRFEWKIGDLPYGYDHKYIYSQIGFNLKLTDFQAAIGLAQLDKLPRFLKIRQENFISYYDFFIKYSTINEIDNLNNILGQITQKGDAREASYSIRPSNPAHQKGDEQQDPKNKTYFIIPSNIDYETISWFGFPVIVKKAAPFSRNELTQYLEKNKIGTRNLFSGNLLKHPAYKKIKYKTVGKMTNSDTVMNSLFWLGVYPGINSEMIDYTIGKISDFLKKFD